MRKGKRELQLPPGVGMVPNKTHWVLVSCDPPETAASALVPASPASSALQNLLRSLGAFHTLGPAGFSFLGAF